MQIILNGESRDIPAESTVAELLEALELTGQRLAVEVNREIIPRGEFPGHRLREGDKVEIVRAVGGG